MILGSRLIAVEGAHGTGKTTFVHALVAAYLRGDRQVVSVTDLARRSPYVEEIVVHDHGTFGIAAQLQLLAAQLSEEQLMARHNEVVICDKSVLSTIAYARTLVGGSLDAQDAALLAAMEQLARASSTRYDAVVLLSTLYDLDRTDDPYRLRDPDLRKRTQRAIEDELEKSAAPVIRMPANLELGEQVEWAIEHLAEAVAPVLGRGLT